MKRIWLVIAALMGITVLIPQCARAESPEYPSGSVTRAYTGTMYGKVAGISQTAIVAVEFTGMPEDFTAETNAQFVVRGQMLAPPVLAAGLTNWSHLIAVVVSNYPFRADADWDDGTGRVACVVSPGWTSVTIEAVGTAVGIPIAVDPSTLVLAGVWTNQPVAPPSPPPVVVGYLDDIDISKVTTMGKHRKDPKKAEVTRELKSASNNGSTCKLSFEKLGWSVTSSKGKKCDGGVCVLWASGDGYVGGFFDHHGVGQTVKTMGNIHDGYIDGKQPPVGAPIWIYLINYEGSQRTNIKKAGTYK